MTLRLSSSPIVCALAFALAAAPAFPAFAQTAAPADTSSSNTAPAAPPAPAPAPAPADTGTAAAATERPSTYTIVSGDSLWSIAHKYGTTVVKLRKLNNLKKGALLHPGQVLQIPPATTDATTK
jgi:LysM repeat protein